MKQLDYTCIIAMSIMLIVILCFIGLCIFCLATSQDPIGDKIFFGIVFVGGMSAAAICCIEMIVSCFKRF